MNASGQINYGGVLGAAVVVDMTTDDGHKYHFKGGCGFIGSPEACRAGRRT